MAQLGHPSPPVVRPAERLQHSFNSRLLPEERLELWPAQTIAAGRRGQFKSGRHFAAWLGLVPREKPLLRPTPRREAPYGVILNTVPKFVVPPDAVVPYKFPAASAIKPPYGWAPSPRS
jgi:hypothetical protein